MNTSSKRGSIDVKRLSYLAILTAMVVVLQSVGIFTGMATGLSVNLSLVPIVIGAALCGKWAGAWLGFVSGAVVLLDPSTVGFMQYSLILTIILCLLKGALSGFVAGCVYKLIEKKSKVVGTLVAGILAPFTNTSVFIIGCMTIFYDYVKSGTVGETFIGLLGVFIMTNFIIELVSSMVLSPAIVRILNAKSKI